MKNFHPNGSARRHGLLSTAIAIGEIKRGIGPVPSPKFAALKRRCALCDDLKLCTAFRQGSALCTACERPGSAERVLAAIEGDTSLDTNLDTK